MLAWRNRSKDQGRPAERSPEQCWASGSSPRKSLALVGRRALLFGARMEHPVSPVAGAGRETPREQCRAAAVATPGLHRDRQSSLWSNHRGAAAGTRSWPPETGCILKNKKPPSPGRVLERKLYFNVSLFSKHHWQLGIRMQG